uniref:Uncharacterized protein n=1 Tax=Anguilla anguilla TaxID=7936 RepID=A0A0E9VYM4_ANGAN
MEVQRNDAKTLKLKIYMREWNLIYEGCIFHAIFSGTSLDK